LENAEKIINKYLKVRLCNDLDYEGIVVDIVYKKATLATLNQDKGIENIEIKLYPPQLNKHWEISYKNFIEILEEAKKNTIRN